MTVAFNRPALTGKELAYIEEAFRLGHSSGNGAFTQKCHAFLEAQVGCRSLLTHSCTAALEMAALLLDLKHGDEVIMPSFTFASTANAFVLRGATPVFVDIRADTLNINEGLIEDAITPRTRAICVVHYAGVACEMDTIVDIARRYDLALVEDAAQAMFAYYKGRALGSIGSLGAISFHETKNIISGEGGALIVNDPPLRTRAETIWEKGTNRAQFKRGEVDRYTWVDLGSSFLPSEIVAAFLFAQLEEGIALTQRRLALWHRYSAAFSTQTPLTARADISTDCCHNGHIFPLFAPTDTSRDFVLSRLNAQGINAIMHYVPLHSAPAGLKYGRMHRTLDITNDIAARIIRLPLYPDMTEVAQDEVIDAVRRLSRELPA